MGELCWRASLERRGEALRLEVGGLRVHQGSSWGQPYDPKQPWTGFYHFTFLAPESLAAVLPGSPLAFLHLLVFIAFLITLTFVSFSLPLPPFFQYLLSPCCILKIA